MRTIDYKLHKGLSKHKIQNGINSLTKIGIESEFNNIDHNLKVKFPDTITDEGIFSCAMLFCVTICKPF